MLYSMAPRKLWLVPWLLASGMVLVGCDRGTEREWPGWRGPDGDGLADGPLPIHWDEEGSGLRWKTPLPGIGSSSPVVADGRVYLTTSYEGPIGLAGKGLSEPPLGAGEALRTALALDLESGELLWETPVLRAPRETTHGLNTVAGVTPVTDGESVYVYFGSLLARLSEEGSVLWTREVDPDYVAYSRYGAASSLALTRDAVVVVQDREWGDTEDPGWIATFDRETGEQIWRVEWSDTCCSYSTPLVLERGGHEEVLFAHSGRVTAYAADSGEVLWEHGAPINQMVTSPVIQGDVLAVSGGAHNIRHTVFLRLLGTGAETRTEVLWENGQLVPQISSPVLYRGLFFTVTDVGALACYDAATGELLWRHRLDYRRNRASLLAGDGKVYVLSSAGWTTIVAAAREKKILAESYLGEELATASPAVAGDCLLIRTHGHLVCIDRGIDREEKPGA